MGSARVATRFERWTMRSSQCRGPPMLTRARKRDEYNAVSRVSTQAEEYAAAIVALLTRREGLASNLV
eukprot:520867-Pyramimonas_sp.AAC.1